MVELHAPLPRSSRTSLMRLSKLPESGIFDAVALLGKRYMLLTDSEGHIAVEWTCKSVDDDETWNSQRLS